MPKRVHIGKFADSEHNGIWTSDASDNRRTRKRRRYLQADSNVDS